MVDVQLSKDFLINIEFFVVIDGIPEKNDAMECAFAMAPMRDHGNTAYMLKNGEWRPLTGYFQAAPGGQTSLAVFPVVKHSVMVSAKVSDKGEVTVDNDTVLFLSSKLAILERIAYWYFNIFKLEFYHSSNLIKS